jgi:hypothetical protein
VSEQRGAEGEERKEQSAGSGSLAGAVLVLVWTAAEILDVIFACWLLVLIVPG